MDPKQIMAALEAIEAGDSAKALEILKGLIAAAAGGEAPPAPEGEARAEAPEAPPSKEVKAALSALTKMTGKASVGEAVAKLTDVLARFETIEKDHAALELSSRRELVADLVKLGVELPATAWEGKPEDRKPCRRLSAEPIDDLRARVATLKAAKPAPEALEAPTADAPDVAKLSAAELKACAARNIKPEDFAARKAAAVRRI